jgi:uncharacterized protein
MRILAIADRPPRRPIKEILAGQPVDLICTLGDLDGLMLHELRDVTDIPKLGVYGNHCSGNYFESLGIRNMHLATFEIGGLTFGGFEGSIRYKADPYAKMYTQEQATDMLKDFPRVDIMLTHCPPYGVNDEPGDPTHEGFHGLRTYVEGKRPKYLLHGHTYPTGSGDTTLGDTKILYVYQDRIIDLH